MNPEYIYADAEEKYVLGVVLYGDSTKLYLDAEHEVEAEHDFVLNACMKGTMADWEVNSITETLLLDVYSYGASLPDAPKAQSPEKEVPLL